MRKPIRAVAVLIKDKRVLLMWRSNNGKQYYVFPGGGVEEGETVEEATVRELKEETSIDAKIDKLLYHHHLIDEESDSAEKDQYFYLCTYVSGTPKLGDFNEKESMVSGLDLYKPVWVNIKKLPNLLLYPLEIKDWLIEDLKDNFQKVPKHKTMKISQLRQNL